MIDPSDPDILRPLPSLRGLIRAGGRLYQPWRFCTSTDDLNEAAFFALSPKVARSGLSPRHRTPGGDDVRGDGLCPGGRLPRSPAELSRSILASGEMCQGSRCGCTRLSAWFLHPQDLGCGDGGDER
jgi:hypothetical protein